MSADPVRKQRQNYVRENAPKLLDQLDLSTR